MALFHLVGKGKTTKDLGVNIHVWDMRNGKTDTQLKSDGIYNDDLEDYFRLLK